MRIRALTIAALALAALGGIAPMAAAQLTLYNSRAIFLAAVAPPTQLVDFEQYRQTGGESIDLATFTVNGATFSANSGMEAVQRLTDALGTGYNRGSIVLNLQAGGFSTNALTITFASPISAFGLDFSNFYNDNRLFSFALSNGQSFTTPNVGNGPLGLQFVGLTSNALFSSVTISLPNASYPVYDNVQFGLALSSTTVTPEPGSIALLGTGLLGIFGVVRRKRKAQLTI